MEILSPDHRRPGRQAAQCHDVALGEAQRRRMRRVPLRWLPRGGDGLRRGQDPEPDPSGLLLRYGAMASGRVLPCTDCGGALLVVTKWTVAYSAATQSMASARL